jgi:pre-rRNA-processing protein TSR1
VFDARPTFSQGGTGSWKSDGSNRAKFERYMPPAGWFSATAYGPVTYAPMPVLVYKRVPLPSAYADDADPATAAQALAPLTEAAAAKLYPAVDQVDPLAEGQPYKLQLVAHGSVVGADPDRVVLKRIVLSGYPIKVRSWTNE